jgi:type IV pilus assembly protein PilO
VFLIVFLLGYYFDITKKRDEFSSSLKQEEDLKVQYQMVVVKKNEVKNIIANFSSLQLTLEQWKKTIITRAEQPELLNEILKIGATNQIYFNLFDPGQAVLENGYYKVPIKIIAVGSYHQLADFISQVANMRWLVVVGDFTISNENKNDVLGAALASKANAQNLLTGEFNFDVYQQSDGDNNAP